jgi:BMFP domain-containing protein YqiC
MERSNPTAANEVVMEQQRQWFEEISRDLARRLSEALPTPPGGDLPGAGTARALREDAERNLRAVLDSAFERMELVTREEFDAQAAVLARAREQLDALEARVAALEEAGYPKEDSASDPSGSDGG